MNREAGNAAIAAILWVVVALTVALPKELLNGQWKDAARLLFADLHVLFIGFLIALDVVIGIYFLQDRRTKDAFTQNALKIFVVVFGPAGVFGLLWQANQSEFLNIIIWIGVIAVVVLILIRFWTYHSTLKVKPISSPSIQENRGQ